MQLDITPLSCRRALIG